MKANETRIEEFLSSNKTQFVIPVYQRNYDWSTTQCKQLLDDILAVGTNKEINAHFIGSIVYVHDDVYTASKMKELTIIDGQQRLTTLTLIYLVIYRLAKELKANELVEEISETYLINKFASEEEKLKLRLTENNDKAIKYLMRCDEKEEFKDFSRIIENFRYFKTRVVKENYHFVLDGLSKLIFVEISLERSKDDPQRIFESLNSTGLDLSQADLIRNYILIGLNHKEQSQIYQDYWEIIENLAKDETSHSSKVSEFMRDYLTLKTKKIPNKGKVYIEFKAQYPTTTIQELKANLAEIKTLVNHYNKLINPQNESDKDIGLHLKYINRLEINVAFPFLMKVYDDYVNSTIDKHTFIKVLELIQSYTWRRFILGLQTNSLNKIFMNLYDKVEPLNYLYSIQKSLLQRTGIQRFPRNSEVLDALKVKDVYNIKSKNSIYLLERLENFENNERVSLENNPSITIEHIFPQNPDPKWKKELGIEEYNFIKENYLNTIGNITLSGNNGKLGNKTFAEKKNQEGCGYKYSRLWLNKYLAELEKWDKVAIETRFEQIAQRFLKIWEYPNIEISEEIDDKEINIFEAGNPKYKKLKYAIAFNQKLEITSVSQLYLEVFKRLFEIQPEVFFTTDLGVKIGLTTNPEITRLRQPTPLNDIYFIESNLDNKGKFDRIKQALTIFEMEDEVMIKYAN